MYWWIPLGALGFLIFASAAKARADYRDARAAETVYQSQADAIDWRKEADILALPSRNLKPAANNARLAIWAVAAYHDLGSELLDALHDVVTDRHKGRVILWTADHCQGAIVSWENQLIISIRGSVTASDWLLNVGTGRLKVSEWGKNSAIPVATDARLTRSTEGFLSKTGLCYHAIEDELEGHGIEVPETIWLVGHSLGGAACWGLQQTEKYRWASAHTYGEPRPVKRGSRSACRKLFRSVNLFDPVYWLPLSCKHAKGDQRIITPVGMRSHMPKRYWPTTFVMVAGFWVMAIVCGSLNWAAKKLGGQGNFGWSIADGHSMESFYIRLRPYR